MLLTCIGRISGRERTAPIGYFAWGDGVVISFSSARWWINLRDGRSVRLLMRGQWRSAVPVVAETLEEKAGLLGEFVTRHDPRTAHRAPPVPRFARCPGADAGRTRPRGGEDGDRTVPVQLARRRRRAGRSASVYQAARLSICQPWCGGIQRAGLRAPPAGAVWHS